MLLRARIAALAALALTLTSTPAARGDDVPQSHSGAYSPYEQETIDQTLQKLKAELDPNPEGKTIEGIDIVPLEVFEERDPVPTFVNMFHATTRPYVLRREVLLQVGEPYRKVLADETARNIRTLQPLSLVIVIATKGTRPDRVRLVVIAKDVWSLRLGFDIGYSSGGLESFLVEGTEWNVAGTHHLVLARFTLDPSTYSFGAGYRIPRLDGRRLQLVSDVNLILNRQSNDAEGSYGRVSIVRPLFSTRTKWGWVVSTAWRDEILRRFVNAQVGVFEASNGETVPYQFRARRLTESLSVVRSFGWAVKHDVTFGAEMNLRAYRTLDLSAYDPLAVAEFQRFAVPTSDTRAAPFVQYRTYTTNFMRVLDFETLALQEDFRLGHDVIVRAYPVLKAFGSTRNFFGFYAGAQYTVPLGDGLVRGSVESKTEADFDQLYDGSVALNLRIATPRFLLGRLMYDLGFLNRYQNYLNQMTFLGGDTRLRGYPSNYFVGKDLIASNLEFRSRPIDILTCQIAGVLFYDVGDAFNGFKNLRPNQSVGFGVRGLFPQVNRLALRLDLGFPIIPEGRPPGVPPFSFFVAFEQAFQLPGIGGGLPGGAVSSSVGGYLGQ